MNDLPAFPDLAHLRKQAKQLLRDARAGKEHALLRFLETLPAAHRFDRRDLAAYELKLHDAQSVIAREYGFKSWTELKRHVIWTNTDRTEGLKIWLRWVHEGNAGERGHALRTLREEPDLFARDAWLACTVGNEAVVADTLARDPDWVNQRGGPLRNAAADLCYAFFVDPGAGIRSATACMCEALVATRRRSERRVD